MKIDFPDYVILDNQSGNNSWVDTFLDLYHNCLKLRETLERMSKCKSENADRMNQLVRQRRRIVKSRGIVRRVVSGKEGKFLIQIDSYGHPHVELLWGDWEILLGSMGIDCNCPDEGKDFGICKHKMAMIYLISELPTSLKS